MLDKTFVRRKIVKESVKLQYPPPLIMDGVRLFVRAISKILWRIEYHDKQNIPQNLESGLLVVANHPDVFRSVLGLCADEAQVSFYGLG